MMVTSHDHGSIPRPHGLMKCLAVLDTQPSVVPGVGAAGWWWLKLETTSIAFMGLQVYKALPFSSGVSNCTAPREPR